MKVTETEQLCADAKLRWRFIRRYLARQPNLPFKRTKKLLGVIPTPARKKRIAELTAGPMKRIVAGTRSSSGNKRKRNSNPPSKWQPGICDRPYLWWPATLVSSLCQQQLQNCTWHQHQNPYLVWPFIWGMWVAVVIGSCVMQQSAAPHSCWLLATP